MTWQAGSVQPSQLKQIREAATAAKVNDDRHLLVLAMVERNRTRAREPRRSLPPLGQRLSDLSSYEATLLLRRLQDAEGGPAPTDCARCARIGLEPRSPCMHDARGPTNRDMAVAEAETRRGRRAW